MESQELHAIHTGKLLQTLLHRYRQRSTRGSSFWRGPCLLLHMLFYTACSKQYHKYWFCQAYYSSLRIMFRTPASSTHWHVAGPRVAPAAAPTARAASRRLPHSAAPIEQGIPSCHDPCLGPKLRSRRHRCQRCLVLPPQAAALWQHPPSLFFPLKEHYWQHSALCRWRELQRAAQPPSSSSPAAPSSPCRSYCCCHCRWEAPLGTLLPPEPRSGWN